MKSVQKFTGLILLLLALNLVAGCGHDHNNGDAHTHDMPGDSGIDNAKPTIHDSID